MGEGIKVFIVVISIVALFLIAVFIARFCIRYYHRRKSKKVKLPMRHATPPQFIPERVQNGNLYSEPEIKPSYENLYASVNEAATNDIEDNVFASDSDLNRTGVADDIDLIPEANETNENIEDKGDGDKNKNDGDSECNSEKININDDSPNNEYESINDFGIDNDGVNIELNENPDSLFDLSVKEKVVYYDSLVDTSRDNSNSQRNMSFSSIGNNTSIKHKSSFSEANRERRKSSSGSVNHVNSSRLSSNILVLINKMYDPDATMPELPEVEEKHEQDTSEEENKRAHYENVQDLNNNENNDQNENVSVDIGVW